MITAQKILKTYWNYSSFRPLQEEIIETVLKKEDVLALMPTGGGKSLCYQVPAILMEGTCLVISPLIALMNDQVLSLQEKKIPAACLHSGLDPAYTKQILQEAIDGHLKLLYIAPERLQSESFLRRLAHIPLSFLAVDEAHCISQWGHDFRPGYTQIARIKNTFPDIKTIALTATATPEVEEDIIKQLRLKNVQTFKTSFERKNLSLLCYKVENKYAKILALLKEKTGSTLIYCRSRKICEELGGLLNQFEFSAAFYHAGLSGDIKNKTQEEWMCNQIQILVCTSAFGMGIDKADVQTIIHYHVPDSPEEYYQEIGRAGRDGRESKGILLYRDEDFMYQRKHLQNSILPENDLRELYNQICNFLKVPLHSGIKEYFQLDINLFKHHTSFSPQKIYKGLKQLSKSGVWNFHEKLPIPSKVQVISDRIYQDTLYRHFKTEYHVLQTILRLYGGVTHYEVPIQEYQIMKRAQISRVRCTEALQFLHRRGFITYRPQDEYSYVYFLTSRVLPEHLHLDYSILNDEKTKQEKRLEAMIRFVEDSTSCKMRTLLNYFGEYKSNPCGKCSFCLMKQNSPLIEDLHKFILHSGKEWKISDLMNQFEMHEQKDVMKKIRFLIAEKKLRINEQGILRSK